MNRINNIQKKLIKNGTSIFEKQKRIFLTLKEEKPQNSIRIMTYNLLANSNIE